MKTLLFLAAILTAQVGHAAEIHSQLADGSSAIGIVGEVLETEKPRLCFTGATAQICSDIKKAVRQANSIQRRTGAPQITIHACAQTSKLAMIEFSLKRADADEEYSDMRRSLYVRECQ